jgi:sarcosine oxidase
MFQKLKNSHTAEIVIVGGGYAGLNAAIRSAELGKKVTVLDSAQIGFGASGRNGGQVIPGLKHDPKELIQIFGQGRGEKVIQFGGGTADRTFDLIRKYDMRCNAEQKGWLQPALDNSTLKLAAERAQSWARATNAEVTILDRTEIASLTGTDFYCGGWIDHRGGQLQPLSYARELARVAGNLGASIFTDSHVSGLRKAGTGWVVTSNDQEVTAKSVLICTNAYAGALLPDLSQSLIPGSSIMCSTKPLPEDLLSSIIPSGLPISDARRLMNYIRLDPEGRFMIGARGSFSLNEPERYFRWLRSSAVKIFPRLRDIEWEDSWGGLFALTPDFLPHINKLDEGLFSVLGCNGRGVAMLSQLGSCLADLVITKDHDVSPLPVTPPASVPLHSLRRPALEAAVMWYRAMDALRL